MWDSHTIEKSKEDENDLSDIKKMYDGVKVPIFPETMSKNGRNSMNN